MESDNNNPANSGPTSKEWKLLEKLLGQAQAEQRKTRRWGIFFKSLTFIYLFALLFMMTGSRSGDAMAVAEPHVAVVDLNGVIMADSEASADLISRGLRDAFHPGLDEDVLEEMEERMQEMQRRRRAEMAAAARRAA